MSNNTGLDKIGIATGNHLNIALTTSSDPLSAIQEFQNVNGIDADTLKIALPFLDLHGVKRLTLHLSIFETIRDKLLQRVSELANANDPSSIQKLETLLDSSFPAIKNKDIRPVCMAVMKHLPKVKEEYLKQLLEDKELYQEAATEVKRQIWENNQVLFGEEVQPLLAQYLQEKERSLWRHDNPGLSFFSVSPRQRRQRPLLTRLLEMVGSSVTLYNMVLHFLRTLFLRSRDTHYCTLRVELLMALHDLEYNAICSSDSCHKFTWCVDACVREKTVNTKRARELQGFLDTLKKGSKTVGDLSIVLCEPYAMNIVLQSVMKALQHCVTTETLPRDNPDLVLLCRMTLLGLNAWEIVDSNTSVEPKLDPAFFTKFLAYMVSLMAEDQVRYFTAKLPGETVTPPPLPPDMYATWISRYPLASVIAMYYCLQCARMKDRLAVAQILPTLIHCEGERAYSDTFLHCLTSYLVHMKEDFQHPEFCTAIFDDFFMPAMSRENVLRHLLRLLIHVHHKIPRPKLDSVLEEISSDKDMSDQVRTTLDVLQEKMSTHEPSPVPSPEKLDSPLASVPAPTPAPHR
ncbi:negative elongation factor b [Plakobranchus ocellatus]|uniref:Negative elongation factor b n=1 Tax=Plakobranchus ocellatus TaxID=259542 RepID=A0AAV4AHS7_9GAST|nr:negative elongation factor b [Plakobranchus ocellatus]